MDKSLVFPNGVYIFREDGTQIDPRSPEGKKISLIFEAQEELHKQNREQKLKWILTTFPRDPAKQKEYMKLFGFD